MSWQERRIGDLCTVGRGSSPRPINDQRFFENGEIPWIKVADATASGKYLLETKLCVNRHGASFSRLLPVGSLIICTSGTLGLPIILGVEGCIHDGWLYTYDYKGLDPEFFYYFLQTQRNYFTSVAYRAAIQNINTEILRNTAIRLPMLDVQSRIASVLKSYDDLIENNRRRMALLEDSARLLYREWFVRLRFPGYEHTRIVDGVPQGWRKVSLAEITSKIGSGFTPRGGESSYLPEGTPLIRSMNVYDDLFDDGGLAFLGEDQAATLAGVTVESKDILLNITGASVARCCMAPERYLPARVNQHVMIIRVDPDKADPFFVHKAINSDERKRQLLSYAQKGSTREALTKEGMARFEVTLPTATLMRQFGEIAAQSFRQREVLALQNKKLRAAHDLLLPRLMSGEIAA
ncbi:restriction endonuclease subunit S [Polaromonas sp. P1-6]|nr:restriction endonuclease subunit S [Polaromonas sp. P1-6]